MAVRFRRLASAFHELAASPGHGDAQALEAALLARRQRCAALQVAETAATTEAGRLAKALVFLAVANHDLLSLNGWRNARASPTGAARRSSTRLARSNDGCTKARS